MFDIPELLFLALVFAVLWWLFRRGSRLSRELSRQAQRGERRGPGSRHAPGRRGLDPGTGPAEAEDLVACRICGAYVASGAPRCGRPDCPRPR